jgi:asparagine synthase (glutamine-hydrolysing)
MTDRAQAVAQVRAETERCVAAWASQSKSILLELSGGLDSSIVAAGLRDQAAAIACVTAVTPDPGADERRYAALVAAHIGAPLEAVMLEIASGDVMRKLRILSPRPGTGVLQQVLDTAFARQAETVGADGFFTGGGGDNIFCYLNTAAPAADVLRTHGVGPLFLRTVGDLATLHGCTTWRAGALALRKVWRRPRPWRQDSTFLASAAIPAAPQSHPWLAAPAGALPGKREHVAALMRIQNAPDGKERHGLAPIRYPLLSQPLVELCLTIPTWMWITGGRNRAVARDAFADRLPAPILARRTKGDFTGFCGAIFERQRTALADLLLGGWLAREGVLDRVAVEAYLTAPAPPKDVGFYRLLEFAGVEAWARSWLSRKGRSAG